MAESEPRPGADLPVADLGLSDVEPLTLTALGRDIEGRLIGRRLSSVVSFRDRQSRLPSRGRGGAAMITKHWTPRRHLEWLRRLAATLPAAARELPRFSEAQFARAFGLSKRQIRDLVEAGLLPAVRDKRGRLRFSLVSWLVMVGEPRLRVVRPKSKDQDQE